MAEFDANEDGEISKTEFMETLESLSGEHGIVMTPADWEKANADFEAADTDNSGTINKDELAKQIM